MSRMSRNSGSAPPAFQPDRPAPTRRRVLPLLVGLLVLAVLGTAGGIALARQANKAGNPGQNTGQNQGQGTGQPSGGTGPTGNTGQRTPPDEVCSGTIKENRRWVCLSRATFDGRQLTIEYDASFAGASPNIAGGFHLHIYGGDGTTPPEETMGQQAGSAAGVWYVEDRNPSVRRATSSDYRQVIGDAPKVCARIARSNHHLVPDANGTYKTGNCVPIERI